MRMEQARGSEWGIVRIIQAGSREGVDQDRGSGDRGKDLSDKL